MPTTAILRSFALPPLSLFALGLGLLFPVDASEPSKPLSPAIAGSVAPFPAGEGVKPNWWDGKEDLLRRNERAKYFPAAPPAVQADGETARMRAAFIFGEFRKWARKYRRETDSAKRRLLLDEGLVRAALRRPHMVRLMRSEPREALKQTLPLGDYVALPPAVRAYVERPFSAFVSIRKGDRGGSPFAMRVREEEEWVPCALLERRAAVGAKEGCPAQGIRLEGFAVLRDEVFAMLRRDDISAARLLFGATEANPDAEGCFSSGKPLGPWRATGLSAGRFFEFENELALLNFGRLVAALDAKPGAVAGSGVLFRQRAAAEAASAFEFATEE